MNKSIDVLIFELREKLTQEINNSLLPISVKTMIVKEVYDTVNAVSKQQLIKQLDALRQTEEKQFEQESKQ